MTFQYRELITASTNSSAPVIIDDFVSTNDTSLAEFSMMQVNRFFVNLGIDEDILMRQFQEGRGKVFERFYGSMAIKRS